MGSKQNWFARWFGKNPNKNENTTNNTVAKKTEVTSDKKDETNDEIIIYAPVNGKVKLLTDLSDEVFAKEMTGKGIAIVPSENEKTIKSPVEGKVKTAFPSGHAYGIETNNGPEILVHIGIDTVELEGKGFIKKVDAKNKVTTKTELADIDIQTIKQEGKETDVIIIATNDSIKDYQVKLSVNKNSDIKVGQEIFKLVKKANNSKTTTSQAKK